MPASIGQLQSLNSLNLGGCEILEALPDSISGLTQLTQLDLVNCSALCQLPDTIASLTQLRSLHFDGCSSLTVLPEAFTQLSSLKSLDLQDCQSMKSLPKVDPTLFNGSHLHQPCWPCPACNDHAQPSDERDGLKMPQHDFYLQIYIVTCRTSQTCGG